MTEGENHKTGASYHRGRRVNRAPGHTPTGAFPAPARAFPAVPWNLLAKGPRGSFDKDPGKMAIAAKPGKTPAGPAGLAHGAHAIMPATHPRPRPITTRDCKGGETCVQTRMGHQADLHELRHALL
ncbi:hypothetical protein ROR02_12070 [Pararhodospirillum oryzae]|uniref:Uncharacterized protein n=1 Tax=Pararhodospirillum oryzae TaxID=478448 RepID=A0A512H6J0_9PROT|nr:hypothetical protein ROR02_12070 [Pararhodospirillum oryzae]